MWMPITLELDQVEQVAVRKSRGPRFQPTNLHKPNFFKRNVMTKSKTYINYVVRIYLKKHIEMEIRNDLSCFLSCKDDGCMCYHINRKGLLNLLKDLIYAAHQMNVTFTIFCAHWCKHFLKLQQSTRWMCQNIINFSNSKYHWKSFCPGYFVSIHKYLKSFVQLHYSSCRILSKCAYFYKVKIIWRTAYLVNSV